VRGRTELPQIVDWYMDGKITSIDLITHKMPLNDINKAFDLMHSGESIRSVVVLVSALTLISETAVSAACSGFYKHDSREILRPMISRLPAAAGAHGQSAGPLLLSGLTCTEETFPINRMRSRPRRNWG